MLNVNDLTLESIKDLNGPQLVEAYNALRKSDDPPVKRFSTRNVGAVRVTTLLMERDREAKPFDKLGELLAVERAEVPTRRGKFDYAPLGFVKNHREGTKRAALIAALGAGATFEQAMAATGWDRKNCHDNIWFLHFKMGYGIKESEEGVITLYT